MALFSAKTANPDDWAKFKADVDKTTDVAELERAIYEFKDPLTPDEVVWLVQLIAARVLVRTRASVYTNKDLQTLVNLWRVNEALGYARLRPLAEDRVRGLLAIYEALPAADTTAHDLLPEVITNARLIHHGRRHPVVRCDVI